MMTSATPRLVISRGKLGKRKAVPPSSCRAKALGRQNPAWETSPAPYPSLGLTLLTNDDE
jgi:hypothetical protein